jgi:hypothetical protein
VLKYVYLIFSTESGYYKIGISKNPSKRVKQLQTGNGELLVLKESFKTKYYLEVEKSLHGIYGDLRKHGEWFDLGLVDVLEFKKKCQEMANFYRIKNEFEVDI